MEFLPDQLDWPRPKKRSGLLWEKPHRGDASFDRYRKLVRPETMSGSDFEHYDPLRENTGLFLLFLETPPTDEGLLQFFNQYGPPIRLRNPKLGDVQADHFCLMYAWRLYEALLTNSAEHLALILKTISASGHPLLESDGPRTINGVVTHPRRVDNTLKGHTPENLLALRKPGEGENDDLWFSAVERRLLCVVNKGLTDSGCSLSLQGTLAQGARLVLQPRTLIAGMWMQLAAAIAGRKEYRRCRECGKPFEIGSGTKRRSHRSDKQTCSITCRLKTYQKRQEEAWELHKQGKTTKQIAKVLGTEVKTVERWVAKAREKHA